MSGTVQAGDRGSDLARTGIGVLAPCVVVLAAFGEPGRWWLVALLAGASVLLVAWAFRDVPVEVVAPGVLLLTAASQWESTLEPGMFLLTLLAIALTGWADLSWATGLLLAATAATTVVVATLQDGSGISGGIWLLGVIFPALMGWAFHRQEKMTAELEAARLALAEAAVLEERRRIARDVHDLVGHGLAAMMLQVTSARHVLDRDTDQVREALSSAEDVGRRTLRDLRRTVGILRDDEASVQAPLEGLEQIADIVADARSSGLSADFVARGPQDEVDQTVGLTLFRIAQASLANAAIHAPAARTVVTSTVDGDGATLEVLSSGPLRARDPKEKRGHYGVRGMRERAESIGAEFTAGPVPGGWLVRCRVGR